MKAHRIAAVAVLAAGVAACTTLQESRSPIAGNWKVLKFELEFQDSGERRDVFGKSPVGWIILTPEGRAMSYLEAENRKAPVNDEQRAAAYRTLIAYTGKYRVERDRFVTSVDGSWNVAWVGTEQVRFFSLEGDRLHITTQWASGPLYDKRVVRGVLVCERER